MALFVGSMKLEVDELEKNEVEIKNKMVGIPKPTFSFNQVTMVEQTKCPPLRKKTKKAVHFPITSASKRKLSMEEIDMVDLKKLKNDVEGMAPCDPKEICYGSLSCSHTNHMGAVKQDAADMHYQSNNIGAPW